MNVFSVGFRTLFNKEILRFWKVATQTIAAPVVTSMLYLLIFGNVLEGQVQMLDGVSYTAFLIPGLVMMSVLQNAFANSSSSLIQSKVTGNLVFILLPPLSHLEILAAYVAASVVRGLVVGLGIFVVTAWFAHLSFTAPLWIVVFALLGAAIRHLGRKVRPAGRVPEFPDHACHIFGRRVLFHPETPAFLACGLAFQPVLLYD
jgi:ABC-2 type transport system permease protein